MLGYILTSSAFQENQKNHFSNIHDQPDYYVAEITEQPIVKEKSCKVVLSIIGVRTSNKYYKTTGFVLAYLKRDSLKPLPDYGDILIFQTHPSTPEKPGNPYEFNYSSYLANKQIYHVVYLDAFDYEFFPSDRGNYIKRIALKARKLFIEKLISNGFENKELSVAAALLTGYNDLLDKEQRQDYSGAGVIHILSVSGLHVGIIFLLAEFVFSFLKSKRKVNFLRPFLIILTIWLYALLTGLAPPVVRASIMFTLIVIGKYSQRQSTTINTLAVAAFILLIINPLVLFDVGFQLSFTAVLGIILFQSYLGSLLNPTNPGTKYIWDIITVSISAQIFTGPLVIYYYHQFPVYFLISNLLVIPLSGIIIYMGILVLVTSTIHTLNLIISNIIIFLIKVLNFIVDYIEKIPGAVLDKISINEIEVVLLILAMVFALYFIIYKNKRLLWISLCCIVFIAISYSLKSYTSDQQQIIIFHKISKHPMISFIAGHDHTILTDSSLAENISLADYQLTGLEAKKNLKNPMLKRLSILSTGINEFKRDYYYKKTLPEFYSFKNKRVVIISGNCQLSNNDNFLKADYVLLCGNPFVKIQNIATSFPEAVIIADNTMSKRLCSKLKSEAGLLKVKFHDIRNQGALIVNF